MIESNLPEPHAALRGFGRTAVAIGGPGSTA